MITADSDTSCTDTVPFQTIPDWPVLSGSILFKSRYKFLDPEQKYMISQAFTCTCHVKIANA